MHKVVKPEVIDPERTMIYSPDKVAVVINGREVPSAPQYWAFEKLDPPRIIINVTEERRRLSLWQAVDWLLDELQRLARHSKIRDLEVPTTLEVVQAPAKRKPRRRRRQGLKSHKHTVRRP
jgi:hypothetical protein